MCIVEIKNSLKPIVACATLIHKDINININSVLVFKARESILQFILNNHPLDCPICDQGGECDLQDQYLVMGSNESRYYESNKKSVKDKNISFILKLSLNKCINCSRCTRFSQVVNGDYSFSLIGRGENLFISNYFKNIINVNEIASNVMDLCPVGAITSKIISYSFRVWEFNDICFLDYYDPFQPPIKIDYKGLRVLRILPLMNDFLKEEWISDRLRFNVKSFYNGRNLYNYQIYKGKKFKISWKKTFLSIKNCLISSLKYFSGKKLAYNKTLKMGTNDIDIYNFLCFKLLFKKLFWFNDGVDFVNNYSRNFNFLTNVDLDFMGVNNFLVFNLNIRNQFPILNFKIREKSVLDFSKVTVIGFMLNLNYYYEIEYNFEVFFLKNFNFNNSFLFYSKSNDSKSKVDFLFLNLKKINFKDLSCYNNLNILSFEFGKSRKSFTISILDYFSSYFLFNDYKNNNIKSKLKVLFCNICDKNTFDFIIGIKQTFERSSIFLNIFGVISDFTFSSYRYFFKELKNEWFIFKFFFKKCGINFKFKLSNFRNYLFNNKWKYSKKHLTVYGYSKFNSYFYSSASIFIYNYVPIFFSDNLSKNNKIFSFFYKIDNLSNKLLNLVNYNKIFWLF